VAPDGHGPLRHEGLLDDFVPGSLTPIPPIMGTVPRAQLLGRESLDATTRSASWPQAQQQPSLLYIRIIKAKPAQNPAAAEPTCPRCGQRLPQAYNRQDIKLWITQGALDFARTFLKSGLSSILRLDPDDEAELCSLLLNSLALILRRYGSAWWLAPAGSGWFALRGYRFTVASSIYHPPPTVSAWSVGLALLAFTKDVSSPSEDARSVAHSNSLTFTRNTEKPRMFEDLAGLGPDEVLQQYRHAPLACTSLLPPPAAERLPPPAAARPSGLDDVGARCRLRACGPLLRGAGDTPPRAQRLVTPPTISSPSRWQ